MGADSSSTRRFAACESPHPCAGPPRPKIGQRAGAVFLPEGERGIGVRLKFTRSEARRLSILESEGGIVGDDEVPGA